MTNLHNNVLYMCQPKLVFKDIFQLHILLIFSGATRIFRPMGKLLLCRKKNDEQNGQDFY